MSVAELRIYPIKSCAGIAVDEALVTPFGLALPADPRIYDRRWMIVKEGRHLSQRVLPSMALIQPQVVPNGLSLRAPNMPDLFVPLQPLPKDKIHCFCWDDPIEGLRYDETISSWFRRYFQSDEQIDLVIFDETQFKGRACQNKPGVPNVAHPKDRAVYQDMCPIHLCSLQSLADLNQRLERKVPIYNFRPNIIVDQVDQPYDEDFWRDIKINEVKFRWISPCLRCLLPTVDQQTGIKDPDQEPWKTLKTYRTKLDLYGPKAMFGIHLTESDEGNRQSKIIRVNDQLTVDREDREFWNRDHLLAESQVSRSLFNSLCSLQ